MLSWSLPACRSRGRDRPGDPTFWAAQGARLPFQAYSGLFCSSCPSKAAQSFLRGRGELTSCFKKGFSKSFCSPCNGMGWVVGQGGSQPAACLLVIPFFLTFFFSDDLQLDHSWN